MTAHGSRNGIPHRRIWINTIWPNNFLNPSCMCVGDFLFNLTIPVYSNLTPSGITDVSHAINTVYGSGNISYHVIGKVCFVYFVFTPSQKCDNVGLLNNGVLPLAKDSLYRSISTWGNPNVAVSLVQTVTTGGLRFWCGESSIGMQIFDSFSYCIK